MDEPKELKYKDLPESLRKVVLLDTKIFKARFIAHYNVNFEKNSFYNFIKIYHWKKFDRQFNKHFAELYKEFKINPKTEDWFQTTESLHRKIKDEVIRHIFIEFLLKGKDEVNLKMDRMIKRFLSHYYSINYILKDTIHKSEEELKKLSDMTEHGKKLYGRSISNYNIESYGEIFQISDKLRIKYNVWDFRRAVKEFVNRQSSMTDKEFNQTYKRFMKFRKKNNINTYRDYQKFLSTYRK